MTTLLTQNGLDVDLIQRDIFIDDGIDAVKLLDRTGRRDFALSRNEEIVGVRADGDGFALVVKTTGARDRESFEVILFDGDGKQIGSDALDDVELRQAETVFGADFDDDGVNGYAAGATVVTNGGVTVAAIDGADGFLIDGRAILTSRGALWQPGSDETIESVRVFPDGSAGLLIKVEDRGGVRYEELTVDANGVAANSGVRIGEDALFDKEAAYGVDIDGDGTTGRPAEAPQPVKLAENEEANLAVYQVGDSYGVGLADDATPDVALFVTDRGTAWAPTGDVVGLREDGPLGLAVLVKQAGAFIEQEFTTSGGNFVVDGRAVALDARELALREVAYDLDLNEDGTIGDIPAERLDSSVRGDGSASALALIKTEYGSYYFVADIEAASCGDDGEMALPTTAPAFPFTDTANGVLLRSDAGFLWEPFFPAQNGEAAGIRLMGVDDGVAEFRVLIRTESETLGLRFYEKTLFLNEGEGETFTLPGNRVDLIDTAAAEAAYLTDLDGDGVIDLRSVDLVNDYVDAVTALDLNGETVRLTVEQFNILTGEGAGGISGQGTVEIALSDVEKDDDLTLDGTSVCEGIDVNLIVDASDQVVVAVTETAPNTFRIKGFDDIQVSIDDEVTTTGTDIYVGAGEYESPRLGYIDVFKSVNLYGAQAGNSATAGEREGGESVISQSEDVTSGFEFVNSATRSAAFNPNVPYAGTAASAIMVRVTVDDVTIDGFTFTNFHRDAINVRSVETEGSPDLSGVTIANNRIVMEGTKGNSFTDAENSRYNQYNAIVFGEGVGDPIRSGLEPTFSDMEVSGNYVDITHISNTFSGARGLILTNHFNQGAGLTYEGFTVANNTFDTYFDMFVSGTVGKTFFVNGEITGNTFLGTRGLTGPSFEDVEISGNTFDTGLYGIEISATGTSITDNTFETGRLYGVHLKDATGEGGIASSNNTVDDNAFTYNVVPSTAGRFIGGIAVHDDVAIAEGGPAGNTFTDAGVSASTVTYDVFHYVVGTPTSNVDTSGLDTLTATEADEVFFGNSGDDQFVFGGSVIGDDAIADFAGAGEAGGDLIDLGAYAALDFVEGDTPVGFEIAVVSGNSVITSDEFGGSITVLGVTGLTADDFVFGGQD